MSKSKKLKTKFDVEPIHLILVCLMSIIVLGLAIRTYEILNVKTAEMEVMGPKLENLSLSIEEPTTLSSNQIKAGRYIVEKGEYILPESMTKDNVETTTSNNENVSANKKTSSSQSVKYEEDENGKYYWFTASCTAYCGCSKCCGSYAANRNWDENGEQIILTASGNRAVPKYTIAMSKNFKFGTKVYIEGIGMCEVMDRGGAVKGNVIDIYFGSHEEALNWGRRSIQVKIYI